MKKNYLAKRLTAVLLTGTMVLSMGGMTAFATPDDGNGGDGNKPTPTVIDEITFTKKVTTDGNTFAPNTTFEFEITNGPADASKYIDGGVTGGLTFANNSDKLVFAPSGDAPEGEYTQTGTIDVNINAFTEPGTYHYTLSEVDPTEDNGTGYEGVTYTGASQDIELYVYVVNGENGLKVGGITTTTEGVTEDTAKTPELNFTNDYGKDNNTIHSLTVTKNVSGNQGYTEDTFNFYVDINSSNTNNAQEWYKIVYKTTDSSDPTTKIVKSGEPMTEPIELGDTGTIVIYGLSAGDTYTVREDSSCAADGYHTYIKGASKVSANGTNYNTVEDTTVETKDVYYAQGNVSGANGNVDYRNDKTVTAPTGIAMTFAPYALMVVFAGGLAALFLRKKKEDF